MPRMAWRGPDREPFAAMNADPPVVEHLQGPMSRERSDDFIDRIEAHWDQHGWGLWAAEVVGGAPFVGYVGLWPAGYLAAGMVEVGWRIASEHWGHGYATETAREALRSGFVEVGLDEIVSSTVPQNERSRRVMERNRPRQRPVGGLRPSAVDPVAYPHLVRHVFYRLRREDRWRRTDRLDIWTPRWLDGRVSG